MHARLTVAVLGLALLGCLRAAAEEEKTTVTLRKDQPMEEFLNAASVLVGRPILYDPASQRVRGQVIGVDVQWSVAKGKELDLVRSILAFYEITLIPVGPRGYEGFLAIDSRSTNNLVKNKAEFVRHEQLAAYADRDGLYVMTSIPVQHVENLTMLRTALSTMVTPAGIGRVHEVPGAQALIVMDYAPTAAAIARMVKEMDVEPARVVTTTILLAHVEATALAATLKELFVVPEPKAAPQQPFLGRVVPGPRIAAHPPSNAIVVVATERDLARIQEVVKQLDVKPSE